MDEINREVEEMVKGWIGDLDKLGEKWLGEFQEGLGKHVDALMKDAFDPERFMDFIRSSGVDFTGLLGAVRSQPAFDPYRILGLDKSASDDEVKKRFRQLTFKLHPDTAGFEGTSCLLQMVLTAYNIIKKERGWQ